MVTGQQQATLLKRLNGYKSKDLKITNQMIELAKNVKDLEGNANAFTKEAPENISEYLTLDSQKRSLETRTSELESVLEILKVKTV